MVLFYEHHKLPSDIPFWSLTKVAEFAQMIPKTGSLKMTKSMPAPVLFERKKMTKATYQALKRHIMKDREKKKQELEADYAMEQARKEAEARKRKEKENKNSLEQIKTKIELLENKLEEHKKDKSKLFAQLRSILEIESSKKQNEKKNDAQLYIQSGAGSSSQHQVSQFLSGTGHMGRPVMYKPLQPTTMQSHMTSNSNNQRQSPSPNPTHPSNMFSNMYSYQKPSPSIQPTTKTQTPFTQSMAHQAHSAPVMYSPHMASPNQTHNRNPPPSSQTYPGFSPALPASRSIPTNQRSAETIGQRLLHQSMENLRPHEEPPRTIQTTNQLLMAHQAPPTPLQKGSIMTGFPNQMSRHHPYPRPPDHSRGPFY